MTTQTPRACRRPTTARPRRCDSAIEDYVDNLLERIPETWWAAPRRRIVAEAKRRAIARTEATSPHDYLLGVLKDSIVQYCRSESPGRADCLEHRARLRGDELRSQLQHPMLRADDRDWICAELHVAPDEVATDRYAGICQDCGTEISHSELAQSLGTCARELCRRCHAKYIM